MTAIIIGLVGSLRQGFVQAPTTNRLRAAGTIVHARDPRPRRYTVVRWRCRDTERSAGGGYELWRPVSDIPRIFGGRIVGVIGASPGRFGTLSAQQAWLPIFRTLGVVPYFGRLLTVAAAHTVFGQDGSIVDAGTQERLQSYLEGFGAFVEGRAAPPASN